jgi:predicted nucleotidyltransferase/DNA-binding XRE family transcriptional regulator
MYYDRSILIRMRPTNTGVGRIGAQLRAARREHGWSTRAAAKRLGLSVRFLNELERGKATVRLDKVMQALDGLGLEIAVAPKHSARLREQVISKLPLLRAIAAARGVRVLWLFGSAARGEAGAGSDLDFLAELEAGRSLVDLVGVKQDLEVLFGRRVDVFTRDSLKPSVLAAARADLVRLL